MDIACSTLAFAAEPLDTALRRLAELDFQRADLALFPGSPQADPAEAAADSAAIVARVRRGPSVGIAALSAEFAATGDEYFHQLDGVARLAKQLACAIVALDAAPAETPLEDEIIRLQRAVRTCSAHGAVACIASRGGTLAENPAGARKLCESVPGLGLAFDPTAFLAGGVDHGNAEGLYGLVRHVQLRDSGRLPGQRQVAIGRGEIDFNRIIQGLERVKYRGSLAVALDARLTPELDVPVEARKLGRVLESLL